MRVFAASVQTETNTFSPIRTGEAAFAELSHPAGEHPEDPTLYTFPLIVARRECAARDWTLIEGICAGAHPAGPINKATWSRIRSDILRDAERALPLHLIVLGLHGAMVAEDCDDCEGDLLAALRELAGPEAVIGATLDPHCHLSAQMLDNADVLIPFKEYPHTDAGERAEELWTIASGALDGTVAPVMAVRDCRMMDMFFTPTEPAASLVRLQKEIETREGVLSAGLIQGFPWGDVADYGVKTLVVADGDAALAEQTAEELAGATQALKGRTMTPLISVSDAVEAAKADRPHPLVLADFADNPGAGCPGDTTHLIGALIEAGVENAAAAFIYDPVATSIAKAAGVGARLDLRIGGKSCALSGPPLDLNVEVLSITPDAVYDIVVMQIPLGDVAIVRVGERFDLVLTTRRSQCFSPSGFSDFGLDISDKRVFVVKSMQHFTAGFAEMKKDVLYVDSPGVASLDLSALPFRKIDKTIWPFSEFNTQGGAA